MIRPLCRIVSPSRYSRRVYNYHLSTAVSADATQDKLREEKIRHTKIKSSSNVKQLYNVQQALKAVKDACWAKFDETIEIAVNLNVDPRKPNQAVKGVAQLPHGNGKQVRVCVIATGENAEAASAAGAEIVGKDDIIQDIQDGKIEFDTVIATPEMMSMVSKVGRILGPRGMMPNPKMGTVTSDVAKAVKAAKSGAIKFKVEKKGVIHAGIGKQSFDDEKLLDNIKAFMLAVVEVKPENLKGKYITSVYLSSTMGPGILVDQPFIDPGSARFMLDIAPTPKK